MKKNEFELLYAFKAIQDLEYCVISINIYIFYSEYNPSREEQKFDNSKI